MNIATNNLRWFAAFMFVTSLSISESSMAFRMIQQTAIGRSTNGAAVACNNTGGFTHWDNSDITWNLNLNAVPTAQRANYTNAIQRSMNTWTGVTRSAYNLSITGTNNFGFATDGINSVNWATGAGCSGNCLALTALVLQSGQRIVETDITFNNSVTWSTTGGNFDVESVMAHELGHTLGIHHSEVSSPIPTMRSSYFGTGARSLEEDDRAALHCSIARYGDGETRVAYRAHVVNDGWLSWVHDGDTAGTVGQSKRMEAAQLSIRDSNGIGICYRAHVAGIGWLNRVCNGSVAGTTGQSRRMEAIQIELANAPSGCIVQYRAHTAYKGWLPWVSNYAVAGTTGESRPMEALEVRLVNCP